MGAKTIKVYLRAAEDTEEARAEFNEMKSRWKEVCEREQQVVNRIWRLWLLWHEEHGTPGKIREALKELREWHKAGGKKVAPKPKIAIEANPKSLQKLIRDKISEEFTDIHSRVLSLTIQRVQGLFMRTKSANGSLPGWWSILLCRQGCPSANNPLPFPVDKQNVTMRKNDKGYVTFGIRTNRFFREGRAIGASKPDIVSAYPNRRDFRGRQILSELANGSRSLMGSTLAVEDGKVIMMLTYETEDAEKSSANATAFIRPGYWSAFRVKIGSKSITLGGDCEDVKSCRAKVQSQRWSRQSNYKFSGSSTKGHGRARALSAVTKLAQRWKCFQRTRNEHMARAVLDVCEQYRVGRVVYFQFDNTRATKLGRALVRGNPLPTSSETGWDWYSFGSRLGQTLGRNGIVVDVVKRP